MGLYENIKGIAEKKGVPISKLEKDLGFARSSIAKFNANAPSIEKIKAIADYFGVKIDDIVSPKEEEQGWYLDEETARVAQEVFDNPETRMLFDAARNARPEDIRLAAEMLKRMKETNPDG